ncbi:MAG: topology modulation protein [Turicibacter sp.]|nr:topology modulation protein [Turicibacter sp.]
MKRIMIIGCPGSGKSTLSKQLAVKLKLPLVHLDQMYWKSNWQPISNEIFDELLLREVEKDEWIIDGNYSRTISMRLEKCDTIIYLDYHRMTCLLGVLKRVIKGYGKTREDMGENCPERLDPDFLKYVWTFNQSRREEYLKLLSYQKDKRVIILRYRSDGAKFIRSL